MATRAHPGATTTTTHTSLSGKVLALGQQTRSAIAELLGLDRAPGGFTIKAAVWSDHALEASSEVTPGNEVVFRIERLADGSEGLIKTSHLSVHYRGDDLPHELVETMVRVGPERLEAHTIESLSELAAKDPDLGKPGLPIPPGVDEGERPRSLLDTWGDPLAYADFFAGGEVARSQLDTVNPTSFFLFVQHSDAECVHVNPHGIAPIVWLVNYPWEDRIRTGRRPSIDSVFQNLVQDQMLTTDLTEHDVIMGNPGKIRKALDWAAKLTEVQEKSIFLSNTCVPVVIGEDVESEVKRWRKTSTCPLLYLTTSPRSMVNIFHDILVDRRMKAEATVTPRGDNVINLIGFPSRRDVEELKTLLARIGVEVNGLVLPDLEEELIDRLPEAALNVFQPIQTWQHMYDQIVFESRIPFITPGSPYGMDRTAGWLARIADALGLQVDLEAVWGEVRASLEDRWSRVTAKAREHRIGIVVRGSETFYLTREDASWGVPLIPLLEEMGFGIDVMMELKDRRSGAKAAHDVFEQFAEPSRHTIKGFNSPALLARRLEESTCQAVLTSHTFDWRVTQAGKTPLSLQHFELGPEGAIRTAERLVSVAEMPLYARYRKYLQRTPQGLRVPYASDEGGAR